MMTGAIMQPTFNPWMGYFDLIDQVEIFVFFDDVQLVKRSWQTRNRIKTANGELFLSIPIVKSASRDETTIARAILSNEHSWKKKHLNSIKNAYSRSPFYKAIFEFIESKYLEGQSDLASFNISIIEGVCDLININTKFVRASALKGIDGKKDQRLLSICKALDFKHYVSVPGSSDYIEAEQQGGAFFESGVELSYQQYKHPEYQQLGNEFMPYLGIFDLLFNVGKDQAVEVIRSGRQNLMSSSELLK